VGLKRNQDNTRSGWPPFRRKERMKSQASNCTWIH
jgi:hypothetical protein